MADEDNNRPKPETFMRRIKAEEKGLGKGKLTIYFGSAPGVGKTYRMLIDAQSLKKEDKDIVVGYVEPHARPETEALLENLEIIPIQVINYKNIQMKEMDTKAILLRKPHIALIDELAHTNAPGSHNLKRYQDVEEVLNAGIDVWTTLNVEHLESLNDQIFKMTGARIRETIPDSIFNSAPEVKLIDLAPEKLQERLEDGKIYLRNTANRAIQNFFRLQNLLALREIALRLVANRVDGQMRQYTDAHPIEGPWPTKDRILVGIYPSPGGERLVRSAFQLASHTDGDIIAFYVETPKSSNLTDQEHQWLMNAVEISKKLGAEIVWVKGEDVAEEIASYARSHNITKIVIGKPHKSLFPSLSEKIVKSTKGIDLILFAGHETEILPKKAFHIYKPWYYAISILAVVLFSVIGYLLRAPLGEINLLFVMVLPVIVSALYLGRGPTMVSGVLSLLLFDYLFVPPYLTLDISDTHYFITFVIYLGMVFLISNLAARLKLKISQTQQSESKSTLLYELSRDLVKAWTIEQAISTLVKHIKRYFKCEIAVFMPVNSKLTIKIATPGFRTNAKEMGVAIWVHNNGKAAGQGTDTLPGSWAYYLPIKTTNNKMGVIGFHFDNPKEDLTTENSILLEVIVHLGAMAIEAIGHYKAKEK
jgi:two-component system, OmpR family, sensor histidine kinase KdpD